MKRNNRAPLLNGNVVGSRGSVIPLFLEQRKTGRVTVTDKRMTRFWITLEQGVRFVIRCAEQMHGGEVFVPKIPSMRITDLAEAVASGCRMELTGIRPGEKVHEVLVAEDVARHTLEFDDMYIIRPMFQWWGGDSWKDGQPLSEGFRFGSETNSQWLSPAERKSLIGQSFHA